MVKMREMVIGVALLAIGAGAAKADVREGVEAWRNGDYARAIAEWQPLAESGDADAQFNLGQAYKLGRGVPQDMARARDLFGSAARQGHLRAEANYGLILFQDGNRQEAMPHIVNAANRGEPRAQYIYGTAMFNGDFTPRDWPRAYAMMTSAARAGLPQAQASLRQMDEYIPLDQRQAGTAMADRMAAAAEADMASAPPPADLPPAAPQPAPAPATQQPAPAPVATPPPASAPVPTSPIASAPATRPTPATAPPPAATPVHAGPWRIQLGSFRERARAENLWRSVAGRSRELAGLQPYLVRAGPYTRLQAGGFESQSAAERACTAVRRLGSECIATRRQ